jgi:hypothetical protein
MVFLPLYSVLKGISRDHLRAAASLALPGVREKSPGGTSPVQVEARAQVEGYRNVRVEVGALEAGEDVPVHEPEVVARRVVAVVGELDAPAALAGQVLALALAGEAPPGVMPSQQPIAEERNSVTQ